jgi:hypothetical protein
MRKTTEGDFRDSRMLGRGRKTLRLEDRLDQENQANRANPFHLDNLLDSGLLFDSKFLLDSEDPSDLDDLDPFDVNISDLHWDDDQPSPPA